MNLTVYIIHSFLPVCLSNTSHYLIVKLWTLIPVFKLKDHFRQWICVDDLVSTPNLFLWPLREWNLDVAFEVVIKVNFIMSFFLNGLVLLTIFICQFPCRLKVFRLWWRDDYGEGIVEPSDKLLLFLFQVNPLAVLALIQLFLQTLTRLKAAFWHFIHSLSWVVRAY